MLPKNSKGRKTKPTKTCQLHSWPINFHMTKSPKPVATKVGPTHINQYYEKGYLHLQIDLDVFSNPLKKIYMKQLAFGYSTLPNG